MYFRQLYLLRFAHSPFEVPCNLRNRIRVSALFFDRLGKVMQARLIYFWCPTLPPFSHVLSSFAPSVALYRGFVVLLRLGVRFFRS